MYIWRIWIDAIKKKKDITSIITLHIKIINIELQSLRKTVAQSIPLNANGSNEYNLDGSNELSLR